MTDWTVHTAGSTREEVACARCSGAAYLTATIPHPGWDSPVGRRFAGSRTIALCPRCDAHDPASQGLLAYFAIHGEVTADTADTFAVLVRAWVSAPRPTGVDPRVLDREIEAWHRDPNNPE
ncbi:DUF6300 family protein [Rhizomonospora bruguierae]|uniref:DUF6300 family protein n=1 Tax=Rhizomonospora bruguierae TaxID=1581705 RepID=UPI001BCBBDEE|nr:DUF6300 family protein [Micromonospora sp. NBRC 107566]